MGRDGGGRAVFEEGYAVAALVRDWALGDRGWAAQSRMGASCMMSGMWHLDLDSSYKPPNSVVSSILLLHNHTPLGFPPPTVSASPPLAAVDISTPTASPFLVHPPSSRLSRPAVRASTMSFSQAM